MSATACPDFATWPTGGSACQDVGVRTVRSSEHQWSASPCSESCDGVNGRSHYHQRLRTTGRRRLLAVHRRRRNDCARCNENEHQWSVSTWSEHWDGINGRSHWLERLKTTGRWRSPSFHRWRRNDRARHDGQFSNVLSYDQYYTSENIAGYLP